MVVAAGYLLLFSLVFIPFPFSPLPCSLHLLSHLFLSHALGPSLSSPPLSPLCEVVQQGGSIPKTVLTCQVIQHSSPLKSNAIELGFGSASAQAPLNQPVHQVTAPKHTFKTGLGMLMGWARIKIMLVLVVRISWVVSLVRLELENLLLWDIRV